jgi:thioredoxin 1
MASANVVQLSDQTFEQEVLKSEQPVLVDFWAEWCGPCRMLAPTIDDLAEEYKGKVKVAKVDTDNCRETAMKFGISTIPTIILFHKGQPVGNLRGLRPKKDFKEMIDRVVPAAV